MSKSNGTQATRVCVWQLTVEGWLGRNPDPSLLDTDVVFSAYLRSQEKPQTYRYLRRWLNDEFGESELVSIRQLTATLEGDAVLAKAQGKTLDQATEILTRAKGAKRDLAKATNSYEEILRVNLCPESEPNTSKPPKKDGATGTGGIASPPTASSSPSLSSGTAAQSPELTSSAKSTGTKASRKASTVASGKG